MFSKVQGSHSHLSQHQALAWWLCENHFSHARLPQNVENRSIAGFFSSAHRAFSIHLAANPAWALQSLYNLRRTSCVSQVWFEYTVHICQSGFKRNSLFGTALNGGEHRTQQTTGCFLICFDRFCMWISVRYIALPFFSGCAQTPQGQTSLKRWILLFLFSPVAGMDSVLSPKSIQSETPNTSADKQNYLFLGIEKASSHTPNSIPICSAKDQNQLHGKLFPVKAEGRRTFTAEGGLEDLLWSLVYTTTFPRWRRRTRRDEHGTGTRQQLGGRSVSYGCQWRRIV